MKELDIFRKIAADPYTYAEDINKNGNKKIIGTFCSYVPEEIITAADAIPFRIFGTKENITRADAHIQAYCCSLVRGGLEDALVGRLNFIEGTVFPHTCDSIQRLSDIWRLNGKFNFHFDVIMPVKLNTQSAREYMGDVIEKFRKDLSESLGVEISDEKLASSVKLHNRIRKNLQELYKLRMNNPRLIKGSDFHSVVKASMVMNRSDAANATDTLLAALSGKNELPGKGKRIFLSGGACNHPDLYSIIEESGGVVVGDELCTGSRYYFGTVSEEETPVTAIADRFCDRVVCPAKHFSTTARADELIKEVRETGSEGVIFFYLKFCDPHSFDYPYMKEALDKEGISSMLLEIEDSSNSEGQIRTRLETFIFNLK